jgi:hypothetical protein
MREIIDKFKDKINNIINNDTYFANVEINKLDIIESITPNDTSIMKVISLTIKVPDESFSWTKFPYPNSTNINIVVDKIQDIIIDNYRFISCDILYTEEDYTEKLWVLKYEITQNNDDSQDDNNIDENI